MFWGVAMTLAVLLGAVVFGMQEECGITGSCESRAAQLWAGAPHEIAGALGGVALMLIAVWLAVIAWVLSRMAADTGAGRAER